MNKLATLAATSIWLLASAVTACAPSTDEPSDEDVTDDEDALQPFCGGIAGFACADDQICVDNPHDSCDPTAGGADCGGICKHAKPTKTKCKDPDRTYVATSPSACMLVKFYCAEGTPFFDACGCGCEGQTNGGATCQASDCGPALGMPNYLCTDGVSMGGPTGNCIDQGGTCGWEIATCP